MKTAAAILVELDRPLVLTEIDIPKLKSGQVLVKVLYSRVCHTQVLEARGRRGADRFLPHCLGHEGSGIVEEVGPEVQNVCAGDEVILSWMKGPGKDVPGMQYLWGEKSVNSGAITTFSRYAVISENRLMLLPKGISLQDASLLGCAIPTGLGTIFNTAKAQAGNKIAIFGIGGIGLSLLLAARLAECSKIIAVDINPDKLEVAMKMGATNAINSLDSDPVQVIRELCPGGVDIAVDASGHTDAMRQALECVRSQGGTAIIVGNAAHGKKLEIDPWQLNQGKRLLGTWGGDNVPERDFPRYCNLVRSGKLNLSIYASAPYPLKDINQALLDLESGKVLRPLIDLSL